MEHAMGVAIFAALILCFLWLIRGRDDGPRGGDGGQAPVTHPRLPRPPLDVDEVPAQ